jgi:hypothetical protein
MISVEMTAFKTFLNRHLLHLSQKLSIDNTFFFHEKFLNCLHSHRRIKVKLSAYKAGLQNNIIIHNYSIYIPLGACPERSRRGKEGLGEILKENFSSPFTKRGIQVHFS